MRWIPLPLLVVLTLMLLSFHFCFISEIRARRCNVGKNGLGPACWGLYLHSRNIFALDWEVFPLLGYKQRLLKYEGEGPRVVVTPLRNRRWNIKTPAWAHTATRYQDDEGFCLCWLVSFPGARGDNTHQSLNTATTFWCGTEQSCQGSAVERYWWTRLTTAHRSSTRLLSCISVRLVKANLWLIMFHLLCLHKSEEHSGVWLVDEDYSWLKCLIVGSIGSCRATEERPC